MSDAIDAARYRALRTLLRLEPVLRVGTEVRIGTMATTVFSRSVTTDDIDVLMDVVVAELRRPKVVQFKQWRCTVHADQTYRHGGGRVISLRDAETGEPTATATLNFDGYETLAPDEVAIKHYSENEGMLDVLLAAGIVAPPHRVIPTGFVAVPVCRFLTTDTY